MCYSGPLTFNRTDLHMPHKLHFLDVQPFLRPANRAQSCSIVPERRKKHFSKARKPQSLVKPWIRPDRRARGVKGMVGSQECRSVKEGFRWLDIVNVVRPARAAGSSTLLHDRLTECHSAQSANLDKTAPSLPSANSVDHLANMSCLALCPSSFAPALHMPHKLHFPNTQPAARPVFRENAAHSGPFRKNDTSSPLKRSSRREEALMARIIFGTAVPSSRKRPRSPSPKCISRGVPSMETLMERCLAFLC
jgi:hypothetical protein